MAKVVGIAVALWAIALLATFPSTVISRRAEIDLAGILSAEDDEASMEEEGQLLEMSKEELEAQLADLEQHSEGDRKEQPADAVAEAAEHQRQQVVNLEEKDTTTSRESEVFATVYDLNDSNAIAVINTVLFLGGVYHIAIEAYGEEWMYGATSSRGTGISKMARPRINANHKYYDSVSIGRTDVGKEEFHRIIKEMQQSGDWAGCDYDLIEKNCIWFSRALAKRLLGEGFELPRWMTNLNKVGKVVVPVGSIAVSASQGSVGLSSKAVEGSKASVTTSVAGSQMLSNLVLYHRSCATQWRMSCGIFKVPANETASSKGITDTDAADKWYSVVCPAGHCCHQFEGFNGAKCVPYCPGHKDHLFANNAYGVCG